MMRFKVSMVFFWQLACVHIYVHIRLWEAEELMIS